MPKTSLLLHPSLESSASVSEQPVGRDSLFDHREKFIERIAPVGVAAIYFGSFTLAPQDAPLSRQALFKLSFLHRHFLQPGGLRIIVQGDTAILSGLVSQPSLTKMGEILARQIDGILNVRDETEGTSANPASVIPDQETIRESVQFLFATDQTLRSGVQVKSEDTTLVLKGLVSSVAQKNWAEHIAEAAGGNVRSEITVDSDRNLHGSPSAIEPPQVDDESLQALVLFRLRLIRETEHLSVRVKAIRGVVTLQGKVRTEALRQRVENLSRSTLGLRELRSSLSIAP